LTVKELTVKELKVNRGWWYSNSFTSLSLLSFILDQSIKAVSFPLSLDIEALAQMSGDQAATRAKSQREPRVKESKSKRGRVKELTVKELKVNRGGRYSNSFTSLRL
jgi:hypothetical protein